MKFNKILALPALALTLLGLGACSDEVKYDPAQPDTNAEVFFASTTPTSVALDNDQNVIAIPIYRANSAGSVTVALSSSQTADGEPTTMFSVPGDVTFADGSDVAEVTVNLDFSNIKANTKYALTLTIDDAAATNYGKRTQTFTITYAPWSEWKLNKELGEYTFGLFYSGTYGCVIRERQNLLDPTQKQIQIVGEADAQYGKNYGIYAQNLILNWNTKTNAIVVEQQPNMMTYKDQKLTVVDAYTFYTKVIDGTKLQNPVNPDDYKNASKLNPETGMITLSLVFYYVDADRYVHWYGPATEFLQMPGYPDYNLYFANKGTVISEEGDIESAVITIAMGADVKGFAMKMVDGALNDKQIAVVAKSIIDDTDATVYAAGGDFEFPMETEDYKTLVCVTYNEKGEVIGTQHYTFYYELQMIDWNEGWKSLGKVNYTDSNLFTKALTWTVELQESETTPGLLRVVKPYAACPAMDPEDIDRGHYYITINATNPNQVYIAASYTSMGYTAMSYAYCMLLNGATRADVTAAGAWGTYKDGKITIPGGVGFYTGKDENGDYTIACGDEDVVVISPIKTDKPGEELSVKGNATLKEAAKSFSLGIDGKAVKASKTAKTNLKANRI